MRRQEAKLSRRRLVGYSAAAGAAGMTGGLLPRQAQAQAEISGQVRIAMHDNRALAVGYVYDEDRHAADNSRGENYWDLYIAEMAEQMGLPARRIAPSELADPVAISRYSTLLIGRLFVPDLTDEVHASLRRWVQDGGTLLGFGTEGLDDLFGVQHRETVDQPDGPFSLSGLLRPRTHPLTAGIRALDYPDPTIPHQPLLVFSPVRVVQATNAVPIADLIRPDGAEFGGPGMTVRTLGRGIAFYAAFSLPQTVWVLHKGRPITADRDRDGYLRTADLIVIGRHHQEVQYADELLWLLQNVISRSGQPLIHQIPPKNGMVPDLLCYWGGDDEAATNGLQRTASDFMRRLGLPYHINAMPIDGTFGLSAEDARAIQANGHEVSLHFNFIDGFRHPAAFTREDVLSQTDAFRRTYGFDPISTVNHYTRWTGWAEPAEWMHEAGVKADNSFIHQPYPPVNPVNQLGFAFGTAFPHYFYRDHHGANQRFDFHQQPITAYEVGYTPDGVDFPKLRHVLDHAARYHLTLNMFYHPIYVAEWPTCQLALKEVVRYLDDRGISAVHLGSDAFWRWWDARHRSTIEDVRWHHSALRFRASAAASDGMIVKVPLGENDVSAAQVDGRAATYISRQEFGQNWVFVIVPAGVHEVSVEQRSV